jgi:hypothetical protein
MEQNKDRDSHTTIAELRDEIRQFEERDRGQFHSQKISGLALRLKPQRSWNISNGIQTRKASKLSRNRKARLSLQMK